MRTDTVNRLAADVIRLIETNGIRAFDMFAKSDNVPLRHTGERYRGGNSLALYATGAVRGYTSPYWMTFKQALELGAAVRKGEKSTPIIFVGRGTREEGGAAEGEGGGEAGGPKSFGFAKSYNVFNACQIEGLPEKWFPTPAPTDTGPRIGAIMEAEHFIDATGADIRVGQGKPCYIPSLDQIHMPAFAAYYEPEAFYATLLHELVHWTGAAKRLDRVKGKRFGDHAYAMEELVAELGAAILCREIGMNKEPREDHAHYLAGWLKALKSDPKHLWTAASFAEKAADLLLAPQRKAEAAAPVAVAA